MALYFKTSNTIHKTLKFLHSQDHSREPIPSLKQYRTYPNDFLSYSAMKIFKDVNNNFIITHYSCFLNRTSMKFLLLCFYLNGIIIFLI